MPFSRNSFQLASAAYSCSSGHDLHRLGLVGDQVEVLGRATQVGAQIDGCGVEAGEHETPVAVHLGRRAAGSMHARSNAGPEGPPRRAGPPPVKPPRCCRTSRRGRSSSGLRVLPSGTRQTSRPAMQATVVEDALDAVQPVPEHQRPVADVAGPEVARLRDLRTRGRRRASSCCSKIERISPWNTASSVSREAWLTRNVPAGTSSTAQSVGVAGNHFGLCRTFMVVASFW